MFSFLWEFLIFQTVYFLWELDFLSACLQVCFFVGIFDWNLYRMRDYLFNLELDSSYFIATILVTLYRIEKKSNRESGPF